MTGGLTLMGILIWFLWGFFMGIGWTLGAWLITRLLLSRF